MKTILIVPSLSQRFYFSLFLFILFTLPIQANSTSDIEDEFTLNLSTSITETYCGGCVGAIDLTVSGGQSPYTFSWSNGQTTEDIDNLCLNLYTVTVTDATGCTGTTSPFVGQNNYPNVELESQAEVDAYVDNFSFCGVVPGVLRIGTTFANPPSDISDISGLSFITSVGSNILIFQNPNLSSLDGLQNITSVGNIINITNNDGLTNLTGFPSINAIDGNFTVDNCSGLTSLEGLNQITSIDGDIYLSNTTNLTSLSALSNLQTVNGELDIRICLDLLNFNGLENLTSIGGDLTIRDNINLNNISALDHAMTIGGNLEIQNTNLSNCSVIPICEMLDAGAAASLSNNNMGCNTEDQIFSGCNFGMMSITLQGIPPSCFADCNGQIEAIVTGGTLPLTYDWSTGVTSNFPILPGLCPDNYSVTVTDVNGMTVSGDFELMGPDPIESVVYTINAECYQSCGLELDYITTGGVPPYEYSGLPNDICVNMNYSVVITDANNCSSEQSFLIPSMEPPNFVLDETGDDINSQNTGYINVTVTGGIGPFSYEWFLGGMLVSTDEDPTGLAAGEYTLVLTDDQCTLDFGPYTINAITGTEDLEDQSVQVFPIPAKDYVQVKFGFSLSEKVPYTLWNATGAIVQSEMISNDGIIGTKKLASGIYFLKMEIDGAILIEKIVVK